MAENMQNNSHGPLIKGRDQENNPGEEGWGKQMAKVISSHTNIVLELTTDAPRPVCAPPSHGMLMGVPGLL